MTHKNFATVAGTVFGLVCIMHVLRLLLGWPMVIGTFVVPTWVSVAGAVVAGYLSLQGFRLQKK